VAKANEAVKKASDIRQERVKEVRAKLARGDYDDIDHEILDRVAEKIARNLVK